MKIKNSILWLFFAAFIYLAIYREKRISTDMILLLVCTYVFCSIKKPRDEEFLKKTKKVVNDIFIYIIAAFGLYTAIINETVGFSGLENYFIFGILWYIQLSVFLLGIFVVPSITIMQAFGYECLASRIYFLTVSIFFGWSFSALSALFNLAKLSLNLVLDIFVFTLLSFAEYTLIILLSVILFKINLNPLENN